MPKLNSFLLLFFALSALISVSVPAPVCADDFPGKGSRSAWTKAALVFNLAVQQPTGGKSEEAIRLYERAISIYPYDAAFYTNLALAVGNSRHDWKRARKLMEQAIKLEPRSFKCQWEYAMVLLELDQTQSAREVLIKAKSLKKSTRDSEKLFKMLTHLKR